MLKYSIKKIFNWFTLAVILCAISCDEPDKIKNSDYNRLPVYSVDSLENVFSEVSINSIMAFDTSKVLAPYDLVTTLDNRYWISADRIEHSIILFNQHGSYLAETGGKGRGSGEFEGAIVLHVGWDNNLYVLDMRTQKITQYQVDESGFTYVTSFSPSSTFKPGTQLQNIYVTKWGNFGVLRSIIDYKKGLEEYQFFELNAEFRAKKRLFTMQGNEKMSFDRWTHVNHLAGQKTFWDFDGEWFYHISSHNTLINKYNVKTGKSTSLIHLRLEERRLIDEVKLELMEVAYNMTDRADMVHKAFVDTETLPLFQNFMVYDNNYYMVIYNPSGEKRTEVIRVNELTRKIQYIDLPLNLWKTQAGNNMIYGTVTSGEDAQIRIVKFVE